MGMSAFGIDDGRISKAENKSEAGATAAASVGAGAALGAPSVVRSRQLARVARANDAKAEHYMRANKVGTAFNYAEKAEHAEAGAKKLLRIGGRRAAVGAGATAIGGGIGLAVRNRLKSSGSSA